jgi:hypothetical protein
MELLADGLYYFQTEMPGDESIVGWGAVRFALHPKLVKKAMIVSTVPRLHPTCSFPETGCATPITIFVDQMSVLSGNEKHSTEVLL